MSSRHSPLAKFLDNGVDDPDGNNFKNTYFKSASRVVPFKWDVTLHSLSFSRSQESIIIILKSTLLRASLPARFIVLFLFIWVG